MKRLATNIVRWSSILVLLSTAMLLSLLSITDAWTLPLLKKGKAVALSRKAFLVGAATAASTTAALGTGAVVASAASASPVFQPEAGSLTDSVIVITGGSSGLGLESAKRLAAAGATIVLTSRTAAKGNAAVANVKDYVAAKGVLSKNNIYSVVLDLDDLESVKQFPTAFKKLGLNQPIDVLLNNAGVMAIPDRQLTKDGYERTFQSNHLGHFALTAGLFPYLNRKNNGATVINVSSEAFQFVSSTQVGLDMDNLNGERDYGPWTSYGLSKLANVLFTQELQRRADASGDSTWLTTVTLHPGVVATDLGRNLVGEDKWNDLKTKGPSFLEGVALNALSVVTKTVSEGASTQIFLASGGGKDGLKKAAFYENQKEKKQLPPFATDEAKAKTLWERSEALSGVTFDLTTSLK